MRRDSRKSITNPKRSANRGTQRNDGHRHRNDEDPRRGRLMTWAAALTGLLVMAFAAYGMISQDREVLSEVWWLVRLAAVLILAGVFGNVVGLLRRVLHGER
jgi:hypothetical protein